MIRTGFAILVLILMLAATVVYYADGMSQAQLNQWLIIGSVFWFAGLFWIDWFEKRKTS